MSAKTSGRTNILPRVESALSLVEMLICVAILIVLVAIVFPTLSSARRSSHLTQDVSNLRQFGVASELYSEANNGVIAGFLAPLHSAKLVPIELMESSLDSTKDGWLNLYLDHVARSSPNVKNRKYPYKQSYFGFRDLFRHSDIEAFKTLPGNPGWLVSVSPNSKYDLNFPFKMLSGPVYRLHFDGSVKRYVPHNLPNQVSMFAAFRSMTDEELRRESE